ncbi:hypothetical protein C8Q76DRAFT_800901 [Earliella scabrosa]|nr:hypothetical protein C8Q76DRAFT_800901 [Earliella scabrosa]
MLVDVFIVCAGLKRNGALSIRELVRAIIDTSDEMVTDARTPKLRALRMRRQPSFTASLLKGTYDNNGLSTDEADDIKGALSTELDDALVSKHFREQTLYPPAREDVLRLPVASTLFCRTVYKTADVYWVSAVGVHEGFAFNKTHRASPAVLQLKGQRAHIPIEGATHTLTTATNVEDIRKGLWEDYGRVEIEVAPHTKHLRLFSDNPYTITVRTTSGAFARSKAHAYPPDKPVCLPVPTSVHDVQCTVQQNVRIFMKS